MSVPKIALSLRGIVLLFKAELGSPALGNGLAIEPAEIFLKSAKMWSFAKTSESAAAAFVFRICNPDDRW